MSKVILDADEILVLDKGVIAERGSHQQLLANGGRYAQWWTAQAEDKQGNKYSGVRLNEDTYTIQLLDAQRDLITLQKADLRSLRVENKVSPMPSYEGKLTDRELDDLVAYLYSLRRKAREE